MDKYERRAEVYKEGHKAYWSDVSINHCPYKPYSSLADAWEDGWYDASQEDSIDEMDRMGLL